MADNASYGAPDSALVLKAVEVLRSRLSKHGATIYLSGIDGSGKTTLAEALVETLKESGVQVRSLHIYQWYLNVLLTPFLLLYNRHLGREVLVLDRGIYDNISVLAVKERFPDWILRAALRVVPVFYPKFDYHFYLVATLSETILRRPDTCEARFVTLRKIYDEVSSRVRCKRLQSDAHLFDAALRNIAGEYRDD
jgi:energy-coupling factor transporter ATP-binding protein EcfA2